MKRIILGILLLSGLMASGQSKGYLRYDTTVFEKIGGNNEVIIRNSTRNVANGVLTNVGGGRTRFVAPAPSGLSGGNLGAGFRIYSPVAQGNYTLFNGYAVLMDSASNANGLTFKIDTSLIRTVLNSYSKAQTDALITLQRAMTGSSLITDPTATITNDPTNPAGGFSFRFGQGGINTGNFDVTPGGNRFNNYNPAATYGSGFGSAPVSVSTLGITSRPYAAWMFSSLNSGAKYQYFMVDSNRANITADTIKNRGFAYFDRISVGNMGLSPAGGGNVVAEFSNNFGALNDNRAVGQIYMSTFAVGNKVAYTFGTRNQYSIGFFTGNGDYQMSLDTTKGMTIGTGFGYAPNFGHGFAPVNGLKVQGIVLLDSSVRMEDLPTGDTTTYKPLGIRSDGFLGRVLPGWPAGSSGSSGTNNSNIGANYEWLKPAGQEIKSARKGLYMLIDSATTNTLTFGVDTTTMFPQIRSTISAAAGLTPISSLTDAAGTNTVNFGANKQTWTANGVTSGSALSFTSNATGAASNTHRIMEILMSGANATGSQLTAGLYIENVKTGGGANAGGIFRANGGSSNNSIQVWSEGDNILFKNNTGATQVGVVGRNTTDGGLLFRADVGSARMTSGSSATGGVILATSGTTHPIVFSPNGTEVARLLPAGMGIGITTITAALHLKAGTATANTAPLKFTAGTFLTTKESQAIETDGTDLTYTNSSLEREKLSYRKRVIIGTDADLTVTYAGPAAIILPVVTANRVLTMPVILGGQEVTIMNRNTSGSFSWSFAGAVFKDATGTTITGPTNSTAVTYLFDGSNFIKIN